MNKILVMAFGVAVATGLASLFAQTPNPNPTPPTNPNVQQQAATQSRSDSSQPARSNTSSGQDDRQIQRPGQTPDMQPQDRRNPRRALPQRDQRRDELNTTRDSHLAALVAAQHQFEVTISQTGQEMASSSSVRNFAGRMVQEHSEFLSRLAAAAQINADFDRDDRTDPESPFLQNDGNPTLPQRRSDGSQRTNEPRRDLSPSNVDRNPSIQPRRAPTQPDPRRDPSPFHKPGSPPKQNGQQPQSALPGTTGPSVTAVVHEPAPLALVSLQTQRADGGQERKAASAPQQRTNPPLVTPGRSPDRAPVQEDRSTRRDTRRNRETNEDASSTDNNTSFNTNNPIVQAMQQVAAKRLQLLRSDLGNLSGNDFDRAFMQLQVSMHVDLVATQSALASLIKSRELQQLIQEGLSRDEEHLAEARRLLTEVQGTRAADATLDNKSNTSDETVSASTQRRENDQTPAQTRPRRR